MNTNELIQILREIANADEMPLHLAREMMLAAAERLEELQDDE